MPIAMRPATPDDLPAIRELVGQLGYPVDAVALAERFKACSGSDHAVLVAHDGARVVGYVHVARKTDLVYPAFAEVMSLCVDEAARGQGIGKALLQPAEDWARDNHLAGLTLGSRDIRKDAHRFYEREGFKLEKVQHIYKRLV
jgi:GNAT superfamily N-acetyltransferase